MKNQFSKYSKEFLKKTIEVWQPYASTPISLDNAREILQNMTALFNFLLTENKNIENKEGKNDKRKI